MKANEFLSPQQLADAWCRNVKDKNYGYEIGIVREFGLHLTLQGSTKSFVIPYANGDMPKLSFAGYTCIFAKEIEKFLKMKRSFGMNYRTDEFRLREFDKFCNDQSSLELIPQQLADAFLNSQETAGSCSSKCRRNTSVIRAFGNYLTEIDSSNAFTIPARNYITGPYADEISAFIAFKKSSGYKYNHSGYFLRTFDAFCILKENELLDPQQVADKWILKKDREHPNTRACRVGSVRVFGKYLTSIGHPKAFRIADDVAQGGPQSRLTFFRKMISKHSLVHAQE